MSTTTNTNTNTYTNTTCLKCKMMIKYKKCNHNDKKTEKVLTIIKKKPSYILQKRVRDHWNEDIIRTAVTAMPSIALDVKRIYPETFCYIMEHSSECRNSINTFLDYQNEIHLDNIFHSQLPDLYDYLWNRACDRIVNSIPLKIGEDIITINFSPPYMRARHWVELVQINPGMLTLCPMIYRTYEVCLAAMKSNIPEVTNMYNKAKTSPLRHVPKEHLTEEMCLTPVSWSNYACLYWPKEHQTLSMFIKAISINPSLLTTTFPVEISNHPDFITAIASLSPKYMPTKQDVNDELACPICTEKFSLDEEDIIRLPCKHIHHKKCIDKWVEYKHTCPICRQTI